MVSMPPFALFILIDDVDITWLNDALTRAWRGNDEACWSFWAATDNAADTPKTQEDGSIPDGTEPPLPRDFKSAWANRSILECGQWLQRLPGDTAINKDLFAVVTEHSKTDDSFTACQVYRDEEDGSSAEIDVEYFPQKVQYVAMEFLTNGGIKFYEKAQGYKNVRRQRGEPDRSYTRRDL